MVHEVSSLLLYYSSLFCYLEDKIENRDEICSICRFHQQFSTKCRYSSVLVMQVLDHMTGIPCLTRMPRFGSGPWTPRRAISGQSHRSTKPPRGLRRQPQQHQQHTLDNVADVLFLTIDWV